MACAAESPIPAALYAGQRTRAVELSTERELDLFEAAALGNAARVSEILTAEPGAARARTLDGFTPLHLAAFFGGEAASARALLDAGAEPDAVAQNDSGLRPINSAAAANATDIALLRIESGATVDAAQRGGFTALHSAAANGNGALVRHLLAAGADKVRPADDGRTPSVLAAERGHLQLAVLLAV